MTSAQTDNEFWFAVPEVAYANASNYHDRPVKFVITTYGQKAKVTISHPANSNLTPITVTIPANSTRDVDMSNRITAMEATPADRALPYGVLITSNAPITVYYEVVSQCNCNPELFVLKGKNALGTSFIIPSQNIAENSQAYKGLPRTSFDIVASQNNTSVTITPNRDIVNHVASVPFTITLNKGEVYSAVAKGTLGLDHLQGSTVSSNNPIAITLKDDLVKFDSCADLAGDQLVPVNLLGKEYIAINGQLLNQDHLFVTAVQNNTTISQDGIYLATINANETYMVSVQNMSTYVEASNPVSVLQLTGLGCEYGSAVLPALGCTGSYSTSFTRSTMDPLYVNLMTKAGGEGTFLINGNPGLIQASSFTPVPGTAGAYFAARITLSLTQFPVGSTISISNTAMMFHAGVLHGTPRGGTRFGYFSNYDNIAPLVWTSTPICERDTLYLHTNTITGATYSWTGPAGFKSTIADPQILPLTAANTGVYNLVMTANGCTGSAGVDLTVYPLPKVVTNPDSITICPDDTITLTASGADSFFWSPNIGLSSTQGKSIAAHPGGTLMYTVVGLDSNECRNVATVKMVARELPGVDVTPHDVVICKDGSVTLNATGASSYWWSPPVGLNVSSGRSVVSYTDTTTTYIVMGKDDMGCIGYDTVLVTVVDTLSTFYEILKCSDSVFKFGALMVADTGTFVQSFRNKAGCDSVVTLHITHKPAPIAAFTFTPITPELNKPTQFHDQSVDAVKYSWNFGDSSYSASKDPLHMFKRSGSYKVCLIVRNTDNCPDITCKDVGADVYPTIQVPGGFSPNGDGINDILYAYGGALLDVKFRVYNRWGQVVFETKDINVGWDGTVDGKIQDADVYAYTIDATFVDQTRYRTSGNVTLIR